MAVSVAAAGFAGLHMLDVAGLCKSFAAPTGVPDARPLNVLRDVSLGVAPGEFVCVLGASGCGKTTLIRAIARLTEHDAGEIRVAGEAAYRPGTDVCMVFQNHGLFPWLTAIDNVAYGLKVRGVSLRERLDTSTRYLDLMGLTGFRDHYPHQLSGGMQQRIGIARALACEPRVLLMDEPFAAVDAQTRERLQSELLALWQRTQMTIVFVTHSIDEAVYLADRIVVMGRNPGRIASTIDVGLERPRQRESIEYVTRARAVRAALTEASGADPQSAAAGGIHD